MREGRIRLFIPCKGGAGQGARGQLEMCYHFVEWSLGFNGASSFILIFNQWRAHRALKLGIRRAKWPPKMDIQKISYIQKRNLMIIEMYFKRMIRQLDTYIRRNPKAKS